VSQTQVVILSAQSLFIEGIENRLKQFPQRVDLTTINPANTPDFIEHIIKIKPATLILDTFGDDEKTVHPLPRLLKALPSLRVVYLDIKKDYIQVVNSSTCSVERVRELLEIITAKPGEDDFVNFLVNSDGIDLEEVVPIDSNEQNGVGK